EESTTAEATEDYDASAEETIASIAPPLDATSSLDSVLSSAGIDDAFPDLMSAFEEEALLPTKPEEEKSSDVIGAEISSTGNGEGAEIASNAANPLPEQTKKALTTTSLLATIVPTDDLLQALGGGLDSLGTPTASQMDLPALGTPTESSVALAEVAPSAVAETPAATEETAQEGAEQDYSYLLIDAPHIPNPYPPASEEITVLLPMLQDESERMREVALQSFRDLPADKAVSALMYELLKQLQADDIQDDGTLSEDKKNSPLQTLFELFVEHKQDASAALCVQLHHNTPEQNALILKLLPHLPLGKGVWPHLIYFVLRLDEHLAKPSLSLLEQYKDEPSLQELALYLRDSVTADAPEYGARVLRLLQKLQTPDLVQATRRFLHAKDPAVAEMAARLTLLSLREQAQQEQDFSAPSTPPPLSVDHIFSSDLEDPPALPVADPVIQEILNFFDLPGETLHKETLLVLRDMSAKRLTHTLLHGFPSNLTEDDFTEEGELVPGKLKTREGFIWQLLCQTPEETVGHLLPLLAHKQPRVRLVTLQLLRHVPLAPVLPYLFRYLLDFNTQIVETCRKLLLQHRNDMQFQKILEWMREQLEFSDPTQAIRAVKVLSVLRDTVAVPNLVELVQHEDRELAEAATTALQAITKQVLPSQHKKWVKWWNKVGSRSERADWLIEAIQLKDEAIVQAANQELIELTGQDFGLSTEAGRRERNNAIQQWKTWRKQHPIF
ncbi:MAG: hypothetical protein H6727_17600, partial [Myxococcales bacterium]|nr:hypothetical protein [Myxococcales bacterium]